MTFMTLQLVLYGQSPSRWIQHISSGYETNQWSCFTTGCKIFCVC